jgi:hypothetical protein
MIDEIKKYPLDAKLALLIRHGDREQIPNGEFGNEVMLNEKGKQNSFAFGETLKEFSINRIYTSPIPRCIQTAEFISKGFGNELEIISTKCLGAPGLHIADEKIAGEFFLNFGFDEMYKRFINEEKIPGVPDSKIFSTLMTNFINKSTTEKGLTVFVTHDSLIAFYDFCLRKRIYTKNNWVKYLDGVIIKNVLDEK